MSGGAGGERRTATVLFTDLVGSTEQRTRLGDDAADALRQEHDGLVGNAVTDHGGEVVKSTGDGLLAVFGSAADALDAAVAAQQAIAARNRTTDEPVGIRAGLGIGDVSVEEGGDVFGTPVVEASRLCDAADEGQILCTEFVRHMAGTRGGHEFSAASELELKGLAAPLAALSVRWSEAEAALPLPSLLTRSQAFGFVGRDAEVELLEQAWKQGLVEGPVGVLVSGEPGAGKTRLASHVAATRHADGATVLAGRCDEDLGVPFQPFVEALRHWLVHTPEDERSTGLGPTGGELVKLLPELASLVPGVEPPPPTDAETERYRLFEAVALWLANLSRTRPVLLVLDDLHWAAAPTLQMLRHLLRGEEAAAVMVLGTYRDTDLDRSHPLADVLADLRRADGTERVALKGLDPTGVERLLEAAAGHELDEAGRDLAAAIHEETDGNAFFAESMIRHLAETGAVEERDGRWVVTRSIDQLGLPEGIREVVGRRLGRLSDVADEVLHVAAVIGPEFDLDVLGRVAERSEDEIDDIVAEAAAAGLLEEADATTGRFSHALVRSALSEEITTRRRLRLHRAIVDAIEEVHAGHLDRHLTQLALHATEAAAAGDVDKAIDYNRRAGSAAASSYAWSDAADHFRRAHELFEDVEDPSDELRAEILTELGQALGEAQEPDADDVTVEAVDAAQAAGRDDLIVTSAIAFGRHLPSRSAFGAPNPTYLRLLEAGLDAVGPDDSFERAVLLVSLGAEVRAAPEPERRQQHRPLVDEAVEVARRCCTNVELARILCQAAWVSGIDFAEALELVKEGEALTEGLTGRDLVDSWTFFSGAHWRLVNGDVHGAREYLRMTVEQAERVGSPIFVAWAAIGRICVATLLGRFEEAEEVLATHGDLFTNLASPANVMISIWYLRLHQGRPNDVPTMPGAAPPTEAAARELAPGVALSLLETGRPDRARQVIENVIGHDGVGSLHLTGLLDEVVARLGMRDEAARLYDTKRRGPWATVGTITSTGSFERYFGLLATCLERWDEAEAHFAEAERQHESQGALTYLHRGRLDWAWMLQQRGDPADRERARALAQQARAGAAELGMALVEQRAAALEAELA